MNSIYIFILIIGLTLLACSSEPEWRYLYTIPTPDESEADIYIKPKSIVIDSSKRRFWTKWIYKKGLTINGLTYIEHLDLGVIDCSKNTLALLEVIFYNHAHNIIEHDTTPSPTINIVPGTLSESLSEFVCQYKRNLITQLREKINL